MNKFLNTEFKGIFYKTTIEADYFCFEMNGNFGKNPKIPLPV